MRTRYLVVLLFGFTCFGGCAYDRLNGWRFDSDSFIDGMFGTVFGEDEPVPSYKREN